MAGVYVDTSALGRVLLGEPDAGAVLSALADFEQHIASRLLRVELRRLALRHGLLEQADQLLGAVALVPLDEPTLGSAETLPPAGIGTLDAVHLATAVRLAANRAVEAMMTFDERLATGATHHGMEVLAPGR